VRRPPRSHPARRVLALAIGLTVVVACGRGVREGAGPATTTTDGDGGTVVVSPTTGPAGVPPGQDPGAILVGDPPLDALAGACFDGDLFACDTLFVRSEVDSELEAYSRSCGGRVAAPPGAPGCADRFGAPAPVAEAPDDLGGDAALDALADACFTGDLSACDDLFLASSPDSGYEAYGSTCAGRLRLGAAGGCQSQLAE